MSSSHHTHRPSTAAKLSTAVAAVPLPTLHLPPPAQTCQNLPLPATRTPAKNEATPPLPLPQGVPNFQTNPPPPSHPIRLPAQTCHNPPQPATPPSAPAQNEARIPLNTQDSALRTPLTPRQRHAARLLVAGHTATSVAALLGLNRHTVSAWKKRPAFQLEIDHHLHTMNA